MRVGNGLADLSGKMGSQSEAWRPKRRWWGPKDGGGRQRPDPEAVLRAWVFFLRVMASV